MSSLPGGSGINLNDPNSIWSYTHPNGPLQLSSPITPNAGAPYLSYEQQLNQLGTGLAGQYQQAVDQLKGQFNFGNDPNLIALRDYQLGDLTSRANAGTSAINNAFGAQQTAVGNLATQALAQRNAEANSVKQLYGQAAAAIGSSNKTAQKAASDAYGATGAVAGAAPDIMALVASEAPRQAAYYKGLGAADASNYQALQGSMHEQTAAQQGALQRLALGAKSQAIIDYAKNQASEDAQNRSQLMGLEAQLQGQFNDRSSHYADLGAQAGLQAGLANQGAQNQMNMFNLNQQATYGTGKNDFLTSFYGNQLQQRPAAIEGNILRPAINDLQYVVDKNPNDKNAQLALSQLPGIIYGAMAAGQTPQQQAAAFSQAMSTLQTTNGDVYKKLQDVNGMDYTQLKYWFPNAM